jgi:hypothetical protein
MRRFGISIAVMLVATIAVGSSPDAAGIARTLTVTPDADLVAGDVVQIDGSGFTPTASVGLCQGIVDATPGINDCGPIIGQFLTDANGEFSRQFAVHRFITPSSVGATVDCAAPGTTCGIGAAEAADVTGTVVVVPIGFAPATGTPRPDAIVANIATGALFGDDLYTTNGATQSKSRKVVVGDKWSWALRVQNDGDVGDDLVVSALPRFGVRFFVGYYDVTSFVTGGGFTFAGVPAGTMLPMAVQASTDFMAVGDLYTVIVTVRSGAAPELRDVVHLRVRAIAPPA